MRFISVFCLLWQCCIFAEIKPKHDCLGLNAGMVKRRGIRKDIHELIQNCIKSGNVLASTIKPILKEKLGKDEEDWFPSDSDLANALSKALRQLNVDLPSQSGKSYSENFENFAKWCENFYRDNVYIECDVDYEHQIIKLWPTIAPILIEHYTSSLFFNDDTWNFNQIKCATTTSRIQTNNSFMSILHSIHCDKDIPFYTYHFQSILERLFSGIEGRKSVMHSLCGNQISDSLKSF